MAGQERSGSSRGGMPNGLQHGWPPCINHNHLANDMPQQAASETERGAEGGDAVTCTCDLCCLVWATWATWGFSMLSAADQQDNGMFAN
jgi:hypothetical protein